MISIGINRSIEATPEVWRIHAIPRREWSETSATKLGQWLTPLMRTSMGRMHLRPIQAIALYELAQRRGLFGVMRVGSGKTLVSLLAPQMVDAKRPILLIPAKLREKTRRDILELSAHWHLSRNIRLVSYEILGRVQANDLLARYRPDMIIADECHKLRNRRAAVTRRVHRYMQTRKETIFVAMSGTITKRSLKDYSRILRWCLKPQYAPIPQQENELEEWSDALDEKINPLRRIAPGALFLLEKNNKPRTLTAARQIFHRRLIQTTAVVATTEAPISCSLVINAIEPELESQSDDAMAHLRNTWETPDGWPIADALTIWRHAREIALGFYYRWNPRPPDLWYYPRKAWASACRSILSSSRQYDSEAQVAQAVIRGEFQCAEYWYWAQVKNTFIPQTECIWLDYTAIKTAIAWMQKPGIVWCEHVHFAETLAQLTGAIYYGRKGESRNGQPIERADTRYAIIASIASNYEGRNLQMWSRNLIVSPPANGPQWEQILARTHREGQQADEVTYDVVMTCIEHYGALEQAKRDARYCEETQGQLQKLLYADLIFPSQSEITQRIGPRWRN